MASRTMGKTSKPPELRATAMSIQLLMMKSTEFL